MKKIISLFLLVLFAFTGCEELGLGADTSVKYEITGNVSSVDITINNKNDDTEQHSDVPLPWTYEFTIPSGQYFFLYVSAQNNDNSGSVTTTIYLNDEVEETNTSTGAYVISTSSTSIN